jgi:hypothetical protein
VTPLIEFSRWGPTLYEENHPLTVRRAFHTHFIDSCLIDAGLQPLPSVLTQLISEFHCIPLPFIPHEAEEQMRLYESLPPERSFYVGQLIRFESAPGDTLARDGCDRCRRSVPISARHFNSLIRMVVVLSVCSLVRPFFGLSCGAGARANPVESSGGWITGGWVWDSDSDEVLPLGEFTGRTTHQPGATPMFTHAFNTVPTTTVNHAPLPEFDWGSGASASSVSAGPLFGSSVIPLQFTPSW